MSSGSSRPSPRDVTAERGGPPAPPVGGAGPCSTTPPPLTALRGDGVAGTWQGRGVPTPPALLEPPGHEITESVPLPLGVGKATPSVLRPVLGLSIQEGY